MVKTYLVKERTGLILIAAVESSIKEEYDVYTGGSKKAYKLIHKERKRIKCNISVEDKQLEHLPLSI